MRKVLLLVAILAGAGLVFVTCGGIQFAASVMQALQA